MNQKAQEIGLTNTHFITPHGLDETEHYTTAYELALLTKTALENKKFCTIVNTKETVITINGNTKAIHNTNELLGNLNGVDGVKTGFTNNAGRCLVTSTTRNGHQIICVVLGADTKKIRTNDSVKLIEYAFSNYEYINGKKQIEEEFEKWYQKKKQSIILEKGQEKEVALELEKIEIEEIPILKNDKKDLEVEIECETNLQAPIQKEQMIGTVKLKVRDEVIGETNIRVKQQIKKKTIPNYFKQLISNYTSYLEQSVCF